MLESIHHIAIICSDYEASKTFYVDKLGLEILSETYRKDRESYKLDLSLNGRYVIELFSFRIRPHALPDPKLPDSAIWLSRWPILTRPSRSSSKRHHC